MTVSATGAPLLQTSPSAPQYQFLQNPGMEVYDAPYTQYQGIGCQVASNWQRFWYDGPEPQWMDTRVFAGSHLGGGWVERIQGETSQLVISTEPYTAGVLQRVTGLTPGVGYGFHAAMLTIFQTSAPPASHGTMVKQVGMDPTGGLDPQAATVVWSEPDDHDEGPWDINQRTAVYAQGQAMTVFVRVVSPYEAGDLPFLNYSFLDSAILAQTPQVRAVSPAASATPSFSVRWDNALPAPDGGKLKWYDVQWLDEAEGVWHDWQEQTKATEATFTGEQGHVYSFRARAWQRYPNGSHLYGPFRPEGDSTTRISGPKLAGRVLTNAGNPVSGATVAILGTDYKTTSGSNGSYVLDVVHWAEPKTAEVSHPWWSAPDPRHGLTFGLTETVPFTWTLRPPDDAITNGGFEAGLTSWAASGVQGGQASPVESTVHTGLRALALGSAHSSSETSLPQDLAASASQIMAMDEAWEPVLSLWYQPGPAATDPSAVFEVSVTTQAAANGSASTLSETVVFTPSLATGEWQHLAYRLEQPGTGFAGKATVRLQARAGESVTGTIVYVDEVSLGSGPGGPHRLLLPLARREAESP
jgi:hypothetical protein